MGSVRVTHPGHLAVRNPVEVRKDHSVHCGRVLYRGPFFEALLDLEVDYYFPGVHGANLDDPDDQGRAGKM